MKYYGLVLHQYYRDDDGRPVSTKKIYLYESKAVRDNFAEELNNFEDGINKSYKPYDYVKLMGSIRSKAAKNIFCNGADIVNKDNITLVDGYEVVNDEIFEEYEYSIWCE